MSVILNDVKGAHPPSVTIYGLGGCGNNILEAAKRAIPTLEDMVRITQFDTSRSSSAKGVTVLTEGDGSGKKRDALAARIHNEFTNMSEEEFNASDVCVLVCSLSGGSGNVAAALLMQALHLRCDAPRIVILGIADTSSEQFATNTKASLQSIANVAIQNNMYVPIMLFSNNRAGRNATDVDVIRRLHQFVKLIVRPTHELDRNDRINWLDGIKMRGLQPGIRAMHIVSVDPKTGSLDDETFKTEHWEYNPKTVYDATINIGCKKEDGVRFIDLPIQPKARVAMQGLFAEPGDDQTFAIISNGDSELGALMTEVNNTISSFSAASTLATKSVVTPATTSGVGGLVF